MDEEFEDFEDFFSEGKTSKAGKRLGPRSEEHKEKASKARESTIKEALDHYRTLNIKIRTDEEIRQALEAVKQLKKKKKNR